FAPRKGLKRKARTTTAGRRRTCSGKPDRRVERGLRPNVLPGTLPFTVLNALVLYILPEIYWMYQKYCNFVK
ncbi:MAG: hypothetical protein LBH90_08320, partial [Tannerella sp.]|nr:hypothetical protein [Tannerella sp.]